MFTLGSAHVLSPLLANQYADRPRSIIRMHVCAAVVSENESGTSLLLSKQRKVTHIFGRTHFSTGL